MLRDLGFDAGEPQPDWRSIAAGDLDLWEQAWAGREANSKRIFVRRLMDDRRVIFLASIGGEGLIAAGATAFVTDGIAGLTNVFGAASGSFRAVRHWTSAGTLVAYQPGMSVEEATRRGFRVLGPLSVWKRPHSKVA